MEEKKNFFHFSVTATSVAEMSLSAELLLNTEVKTGSSQIVSELLRGPEGRWLQSRGGGER